MPLLIKCACIWSNLLELSSERVNRVTVCVVVPCVTSTTCTGILAGLDCEVGVVVGVTVGVTATTGACPLAGVPLALTVDVRVAVVVGVVRVFGVALVGSAVAGLWISL